MAKCLFIDDIRKTSTGAPAGDTHNALSHVSVTDDTMEYVDTPYPDRVSQLHVCMCVCVLRVAHIRVHLSSPESGRVERRQGSCTFTR